MDSIVINTKIYPKKTDQTQLRSIVFGAQPLILVELIAADEDRPTEFRITASRMGDDIEDISDLLQDLGESMVDAVKKGNVLHG